MFFFCISFCQSCWNLWCHIPWRRRRARWTFVGFRWIYIGVWAGTWCPNSYGGIVRCGGQHWWVHRIPWDTIHGSSMAGQFGKRFFALYVPNVHLKEWNEIRESVVEITHRSNNEKWKKKKNMKSSVPCDLRYRWRWSSHSHRRSTSKWCTCLVCYPDIFVLGICLRDPTNAILVSNNLIKLTDPSSSRWTSLSEIVLELCE